MAEKLPDIGSAWISIPTADAFELLSQGSSIYAVTPCAPRSSAVEVKCENDGFFMLRPVSARLVADRCLKRSWLKTSFSDVFCLSHCSLYLDPDNPECQIPDYLQPTYRPKPQPKPRREFTVADLVVAFHYAFYHRDSKLKPGINYKLSGPELEAAEKEVREILLWSALTGKGPDALNPGDPKRNFVFQLSNFLDEPWEQYC